MPDLKQNEEPKAAAANLGCCTWQDPKPALRCTAPAVAQHVASDGEVWCKLCVKHDAELRFAQDAFLVRGVSGSITRLMRAWVRAGGGSELMEKRTIGGK